MSKATPSLLHGEYRGQVDPTAPAPISALPVGVPIASCRCEAPSLLETRPAPSNPAPSLASQDLTAFVTQLGQEVKEQLAVYQFTPSLKFKFHVARESRRPIRIRRYRNHYTVSLELRTVELAACHPRGATHEHLLRDLVYSLAKRAHASALPLGEKPWLRAFLGLVAFTTLTTVLAIISPNPHDPWPLLFGLTLAAEIVGLVGTAIPCLGLDLFPDSEAESEKLPKRLLRHWDETTARQFLTAYATTAELNNFESRLSSHRSRLSRQQAAARAKDLKGIKL